MKNIVTIILLFMSIAAYSQQHPRNVLSFPPDSSSLWLVGTDTSTAGGAKGRATYLDSAYVANALGVTVSSADGDGIYDGSGTVPTTTVATITDSLEFVASSDGDKFKISGSILSFEVGKYLEYSGVKFDGVTIKSSDNNAGPFLKFQKPLSGYEFYDGGAIGVNAGGSDNDIFLINYENSGIDFWTNSVENAKLLSTGQWNYPAYDAANFTVTSSDYILAFDSTTQNVNKIRLDSILSQAGDNGMFGPENDGNAWLVDTVTSVNGLTVNTTLGNFIWGTAHTITNPGFRALVFGLAHTINASGTGDNIMLGGIANSITSSTGSNVIINGTGNSITVGGYGAILGGSNNSISGSGTVPMRNVILGGNGITPSTGKINMAYVPSLSIWDEPNTGNEDSVLVRVASAEGEVKVMPLISSDGSNSITQGTDGGVFLTSAGGDNWGSDVVNTDLTLTGDGTVGNVLKVDTSEIATQYDLTLLGGDDWGTDVVNTDLTLTGDGTVGNALKVDTTIISTKWYVDQSVVADLNFAEDDLTFTGNRSHNLAGYDFTLVTNTSDHIRLSNNTPVGRPQIDYLNNSTTWTTGYDDVVSSRFLFHVSSGSGGAGTETGVVIRDALNDNTFLFTSDWNLTANWAQFHDYGEGNLIGTGADTAIYVAGFDLAGVVREIELSDLVGGSDNWGTDTVISDITLTGQGIVGDSLKVDTSIIATQWDLTQIVGDNWGTDVVNTDLTLTGDGTVGNVLKVDTSEIATQYDLTLIGGTDYNFAEDDLTFTANRSHDLSGFDFKLADGAESITYGLSSGVAMNLIKTGGGSIWFFQATNGDNEWRIGESVGDDFVIKDETAGKTPFQIEVGQTRNNALRIENSGQITLGDYLSAGVNAVTDIGLLAHDASGSIGSLANGTDNQVLTMNGTVMNWEAIVGDNWGSDTIVSDATLTGQGVIGDSLKVDTTIISTKWYVDQGGAAADGNGIFDLATNEGATIGITNAVLKSGVLDFDAVNNTTNSTFNIGGPFIQGSGSPGRDARVKIKAHNANAYGHSLYLEGNDATNRANRLTMAMATSSTSFPNIFETYVSAGTLAAPSNIPGAGYRTFLFFGKYYAASAWKQLNILQFATGSEWNGTTNLHTVTDFYTANKGATAYSKNFTFDGDDLVMAGYGSGSKAITEIYLLGVTDAGLVGEADPADYGPDDWGTDVVNTDLTLTGDGTVGSVLKVDTSEIATQYDLTLISGDDWGTDVVNTDLTLTGDGTVGNVLKVDTSEIATQYDLTLLGGSSEWTRTGSDIYPNNTTDIVGIGNTNPTEELHITASTPTFLLEGNGGNAAIIEVNNTVGGTGNVLSIDVQNSDADISSGSLIRIGQITFYKKNLTTAGSDLRFFVQGDYVGATASQVFTIKGGDDSDSDAYLDIDAGVHYTNQNGESSNYTILNTDYIVKKSTGSSGVVFTIPDDSGCIGCEFIISNVDTEDLTVALSGSDVANGVGTDITLTEDESIRIINVSTNEWIYFRN